MSIADLKPVPAEQLISRTLPAFARPEEERRHRKENLAIVLRLFGRFGFEEGTAGHVTARDPEYTDHFWVNPFGLSFKHVRVSDLLLVGPDGRVVEGRYPVDEAGFTIHSQIHAARPDVVSAAHTHSVHGRALAALGTELEPITQDACAFYQAHAVYDDYNGVVTDAEEGRRIATALGKHKAVILRNHGLLTVGQSVESAGWWFITMERSCQVQLLAKAAGRAVWIDHDTAAAVRDELGSEEQGWVNFQPLRDQVLRTEPDVLD
jgi:ribulose-5-phosphate 4-epimerase/fuculose-1-phosphate aldolase